jgi:hypothetical protein
MRFLPMLLLSSGCMLMSNAYSTREQVATAAREYNEGVRWGKLEQAAAHIPKDRRKQFFERHKTLEDDLEISDYEVVAIDVDKSDKKHPKISTRVDYTWSLKREGLVHKTSTRQHWEERDSDWILFREERVKGTPLTLFEETASP